MPKRAGSNILVAASIIIFVAVGAFFVDAWMRNENQLRQPPRAPELEERAPAEDDPEWDCTANGDRRCGVSKQATIVEHGPDTKQVELAPTLMLVKMRDISDKALCDDWNGTFMLSPEGIYICEVSE